VIFHVTKLHDQRKIISVSPPTVVALLMLLNCIVHVIRPSSPEFDFFKRDCGPALIVRMFDSCASNSSTYIQLFLCSR